MAPSFSDALVDWALAGPFAHYSPPWLLTVNAISAIVTLLMVFLIQYGQTREVTPAQAKLNEIIRALEEARSRLIGIGRLTRPNWPRSKRVRRGRGRDRGQAPRLKRIGADLATDACGGHDHRPAARFEAEGALGAD